MRHCNIRKWVIWFLSIAITLCVVCISVCNLIIKNHSSAKLYSDINDIPDNNVGLLLGTSPKLRNGKNNLYFDYRILATVDLYNAGKINYILISGDNRKRGYNEPEEMKNALLQKGVPENVIFLDYAGFRTLDSVVRAKEIFGQSQFTLISQRFHNERAIYLANSYEIDAIGFNAEDVDVYNGLKTQIRELLARVKMFLDLATNKQPHFLGDKVIIGNQ